MHWLFLTLRHRSYGSIYEPFPGKLFIENKTPIGYTAICIPSETWDIYVSTESRNEAKYADKFSIVRLSPAFEI